MKIKIFFLVTLIAITAILLLGGCQKTENEIKIGVITPLSGPAASYGELEIKAIQLAVDEINNQGGINGKVIKIIAEDGKCNGKDAATAAQKLVNVDKVKIILGGACSSETLAILPITEKNKVLVMTGVSGNPQITESGYKYVLRFIARDDAFYPPGAEYFFNLGYKKVAIITENTDYCIGAKDVFIKKFEELGGEVTTVQIANPEERDYRSYITKIKETNPEAVVIIPQTPQTGGLMAKQIKELMPDIQILGSFGMESPDAIEAAQGALEGAIIFSGGSHKVVEVGKEIITKYKEKYGEEPFDAYTAILAYDRVYVAKEAIEYCGKVNVDCMIDYIKSTEFHLGLGNYSFDEKGDINLFYVGIFKIENNTAKIIDEKVIRK